MGCTSCKKKKVAQSPEELHSQEITEWNGGQPTWEEIKQAYDDLTSYGGVKPGKHESINKVYQALHSPGGRCSTIGTLRTQECTQKEVQGNRR